MPSELAPTHYVPRPELTDPLLAYLLCDEPAPHGRAMISAVHGLGGIGKTTVARWLVWLPEVERRFADGRLWVTLGKDPVALTVINECLSQLDPTLKKATTEKAASDTLASILHDRSILFVIDDVWPESAGVAKALLVASPCSRFVLTTRFALQLADDLRARDFPLDEMGPDQAVELVRSTLGRALSQAELPLAERLCEVVGGHPLALELAAARIKVYCTTVMRQAAASFMRPDPRPVAGRP